MNDIFFQFSDRKKTTVNKVCVYVKNACIFWFQALYSRGKQHIRCVAAGLLVIAVLHMLYMMRQSAYMRTTLGVPVYNNSDITEHHRSLKYQNATSGDSRLESGQGEIS